MEAISHLSRSSLHRLFQGHGFSQLPKNECKEKREKKQLKQYPIGYFYVDISEVRSEEEKLYLFVAIDRTSKFAYVELVKEHGKLEAAQLLQNLMKPILYKINTVLTDNDIPLTNRTHTNSHACTCLTESVWKIISNIH